MSAAALCVGVGTFSEPDSLPGLAHLLEHMLFMGSREFPEENDFDKFIKSYGGSSNAHTHLERTVFFFDIHNVQFAQALKRFSGFFIDPCLNKGSMDRELKLVHSEWAMKLQLEQFRFEQLLGSMARGGHPMGKFSWGNVESLKTLPTQQLIDVHAELSKFHQQFYLAQFMSLVVYANESLEDLSQIVEEFFSKVPSSSESRPSFKHFGPPFDTPEFRKIYRIIPAKKTQHLKMTWALDSLLESYRKKPLQYLANLIGHEGEGSLLALLKKQGWARGIRAGNAETNQEHNSVWAQFNVQLIITDKGLNHIVEVIKAVFQYITLLRNEGAKKHLFEEMMTIDRNSFDWMDAQEPQEFCHHLAIDMEKYAAEDFITGGRMIMDYDPMLIKQCLDKLQPQTMNVAIWSRNYETEIPALELQTEHWFKTRYHVKEISSDLLQAWSNCGTAAELHLPNPNVYIDTRF